MIIEGFRNKRMAIENTHSHTSQLSLSPQTPTITHVHIITSSHITQHTLTSARSRQTDPAPSLAAGREGGEGERERGGKGDEGEGGRGGGRCECVREAVCTSVKTVSTVEATIRPSHGYRREEEEERRGGRRYMYEG